MQLKGMPYVAGIARGVLLTGMSEDPSGRIVIVRENKFRPFAKLPAGLVIVDGSPFAHAMIPVLGCGVPTIIVSSEQAAGLRNDTEVMLNGSTGIITDDLTSEYQQHTEPVQTNGRLTADNIEIQLRVSVRDIQSAHRAMTSAANAIGLVRSEFFLPADGYMPDLAFYRREFKSLAMAVAPLPVTIRLIDIAADKLPAWLPALDGVRGTLGLQGVRLFSHEPVRSVYRAQLAAIDKLSSEFDIRVLIPYLASQEELLEWANRVGQELSKPLPLGAMAETPAAALQIAEWLEVVDFVALGCNDLMQCLFGADRDRPELRQYLDPYAPSLYRFLRQVAEGVQGQLHRVQLCGVLSQLPGILPVLLGLGFRVFSVEAASLDYLRQTIAVTSISGARKLAQRVCTARDSKQVHDLITASMMSEM